LLIHCTLYMYIIQTNCEVSRDHFLFSTR
jgi:hypothetical protein